MESLATLIGSSVLKELAGPAKTFAGNYGKQRYDKFIVELCNCFQEHANFAYNRCSSIKNILYKDNSVDLKSQYVNIYFSKGGDSARDSEIVDKIFESSKILVSGTAGARKTMFMKWSVLQLIDRVQEHQKIPLFLELRYVTADALSQGLVNYIFESTRCAEGTASIDRFKIGLEIGQFVLILDAVDEVRPELREKVLGEIQQFLNKYPRCSVLISSRPDDELESFQDLEVYSVSKMKLEQIVDVLNKINFDNEVKSSLIERLSNGLFEQQKDFLSNPLLATIMLISFDYSADIPNKLTSFYRQAFEALYQRHDAAKGGYRRGHFAGLPLDEYEKIFSAFCFDSFIDSKVQFSDSELIDYFRAASKYCNLKCDANLLVEDARKSVCVIQREGLDNVFAHRTFQEYFTALFLSRYREGDFVEQVSYATFGWRNNNILKMLLEISPEPVEFEWLEPYLKPNVDIIRRARASTLAGSKKIFRTLYKSIDITTEGGFVRRFANDTGHKNMRLSMIGMSYEPPVKLNRIIFDGPPVFESLKKYQLDYPELEYPQDIENRMHYFPSREGEDDEELIEVYEQDLKWLIHSNLPMLLGRARDDVVNFYDAMVERISNRSAAMNRMRFRKKIKNPIRLR